MHEFSEVSFDIEKSHEYILSIQVSLNGFSFSVLRSSDNSVLAFKSLPLQISSNALLVRRFKEWLHNEELLNKTYQKVRVILFSERFTLIPSTIQSESVNEEVLHTLFKDADSLQFAENWIPGINAKLLFSIPNGIQQSLSNTIGETELVHPLKLVLLHLLSIPHKNILLVLFDKNSIQLVLFKNGKLILANHFKVKHENDVVYYILSTIKSFSLSLEDAGLLFSGSSAFIEGSITTLKKHRVIFERFPSDNLKITTEITEKIWSEHLSLFL